MILSSEIMKSRLAQFSKNPSRYTIIDNKRIKLTQDRIIFEINIEMLEFANHVRFANKFFLREMGKTKFDLDIIFNAMNSVYSEKSLDETDLKVYYEYQKEVVSFLDNLREISDANDYGYTSTHANLLLSGLTIDELFKLKVNRFDDCDGISDQYVELLHEYLWEDLNYEEFKFKVDKLIAKFRELINIDQECPKLDSDKQAA